MNNKILKSDYNKRVLLFDMTSNIYNMTFLKAHKLERKEKKHIVSTPNTLHTGRSGSPKLTSKLSHFKSK